MLHDAWWRDNSPRPCSYPLGTVAGGHNCRGRACGTYQGIDKGNRHNDGGNIVFVDGHAKWLKDQTWNLYPEHYAKYWQMTR